MYLDIHILSGGSLSSPRHLQHSSSLNQKSIHEKFRTLVELLEAARAELYYDSADYSKLSLWMNMAVNQEKVLYTQITQKMDHNSHMVAKMVQLDGLSKKRIQGYPGLDLYTTGTSSRSSLRSCFGKPKKM